jgi:hypothetical protein
MAAHETYNEMVAPTELNNVIAVGDPSAMFDFEEVDISGAGKPSHAFNIKGSNLIFAQSIVVNYTSWRVDIQISLDRGVTWTTILASFLTATGPVNTATFDLPAMGIARLLLIGTSSGGTDTAVVYACIGTV